MVYILIAILIFGVLIAVHEFGHFLAAKACGVRVNEFSIGMGPQLFHKTKGDTEYSLRLLPIGGYCAMEGEDEDSDDDRALGRQVWWKKFIIFVAGAFMNFLTGLIIVICLYAGAQAFYTTEIVELNPDFPQQGEDGLMPGDTIYAINGERIYLKSDVSLIMGLGDTGTIDMTVLRDGKKFDRTLTRQVYTDENGKEYEAYGFTYGGIVEATPLLRLQYSWYQTMDYVRIVRLSLQMLLSGAAGVNDLSGPVGIVSTITEVGKETEAEAGFGAALESILYFAAMIAVNLAVMNLLPLPALDGGHVLFLLVNGIAVALFKKEIPSKYLNVINGVGFLGAGTILVTGRREVKGLTTAAGLWASACMGLAIGAGFYECVFLGTVLIFLSMRYLPIVENMMVEHAPFLNIYVEFESLDHIGDVIGRIKEQNAQVLDVEVDHGRGPGSSNPSAVFSLRLAKRHSHSDVLVSISELDCVYTVEEF